MFCSISGQSPRVPVITRAGHVFEKDLILKYLETNGKCPITNEPLSEAELIEIKAPTIVKPRPLTATSIPSMLQTFQNEWDATMLELFSLKQQLETAKQQLAQSLYQHDAACRVIARLIKERDASRNALATARAQLAADNFKSTDMQIEQAGVITDEIKEKITNLSKKLSSERRVRSVSSDLLKANDIKNFSCVASHPIHKTTPPGICCIDLHPTQQNKIVSGGADKTVVVFDIASNKKEAVINAHTKIVSGVLFHPQIDAIFSCSHDKTAAIWRPSEDGYSLGRSFKAHTAAVVDLSLHPCNDYIATASLDSAWAFYDIETGSCLAHLQHPQSRAGLSCINFHPDGLIVATGTTNNLIRVWDLKVQSIAATLEGHESKIVDVAFSEKGYHLATASDDGVVKLWDLRKSKVLHSIKLESGHELNSIDFDYSGTYVVTAGADIRVFVTKSMEHTATFSNHNAQVTGVKFGQNASFLVSSSMDRTIKIFK
eukprot:TRINITY_DN488_c1_g1_i1.p1 TRINITY_DN488_c1_g1~~TRINITY_DN488_c1_g1_i1.p1  ORF type:complete len:488 (+),score=185.78 TRINITY_DN488_c1_g1_i1:151-1614(+)